MIPAGEQRIEQMHLWQCIAALRGSQHKAPALPEDIYSLNEKEDALYVSLGTTAHPKISGAQ